MAATVQIGRFQDQLKKLFGLKENVSTEVVEQVMPVQELMDIQAPETYRLRSEQLWAQGAQSAAGVGQEARVQIGFDPAFPSTGRSTLITIIDEVHILHSSAPNGLIEFNLTPGVNLTTPGSAVRYRDARSIPTANFGVSPFGFTQLATDQPASGSSGTSLGFYRTPPQVDFVFKLGVVLVPFSRLDITMNNASNTLNVFVLGRERQLDASEQF